MRINEFTQNKLSEAVPKGVRKDFDVNSIPKNNREAAYLKQLKLIQMQLKVGKNTKSVLGLRDYQTDPDADGGQETPMDPVDDDPMSAVNQEKDRTTVPTGGFNINKRKVVGTRPRTTFTSLAKASGIADPNKIKVGQKITLPSGGTYNVVSGDTLSGIAQRVRTGKIGGGGNDGTTTQSNLAPPKATPKKDFGLGGLDVTGPVRRGDGKNSAVKDLPPVRNVKTFKTTPLQTNKVDPDDAMTAPNQAKDRMTKPVNRINRGTDPSNMVTPQLGATPNRVSQGSTTAKKSVGDAGGFTGKFIDKKGNVAYTSPKAFAQNLLPGVFGTPKGQEIPSNLKRINPATKGAEKGTRFQQVDAPKPVNKDANFFSKEFDKVKSDFKTAVDTTKSNFAGDRKLGTGRFSGNNKPRYNAIENKDIKERYRDFSPTKSDAIGAQAAAAFYKSKTAPNNDEVLDQKVIINKQLQDIVANKVKLAKNMSKTAGVKPNSSKLPKPLGANEPDNEFSGVPGTGNVKKGTGKTNTTKFSSNQRYNAIENKDIKNERH